MGYSKFSRLQVRAVLDFATYLADVKGVDFTRSELHAMAVEFMDKEELVYQKQLKDNAEETRWCGPCQEDRLATWRWTSNVNHGSQTLYCNVCGAVLEVRGGKLPNIP